jgi:protein tyrosine/serine phosphatase
MTTRHIPFEGIHNFRDFGGYRAHARTLKSGLLYRSANHAYATDADLRKLAELNLAVIVDLRRPNEREREPCRRWEGFGARVIENDIGEDRDDEWRDFIASSDLTVESIRNYMLDYYRRAPFWTRHLDLYSRWFQALAEADGPVLVHCAAGKDRTGIICALTHHVAGVHDDDIVADFLLTNDPERLAKRLPFMRDHIREISGRTPPDDAVLTNMGVEAAYLEEAFRAMREAHGSLDGYLEQALGLDGELRERIHDRLLA